MEDKTIWADEIVRSSQNISEIEGNYCLLCDKIVTWKFDSPIKAINIMSKQGWECVSIAATAGNLYALIKEEANRKLRSVLSIFAVLFLLVFLVLSILL